MTWQIFFLNRRACIEDNRLYVCQVMNCEHSRLFMRVSENLKNLPGFIIYISRILFWSRVLVPAVAMANL